MYQFISLRELKDIRFGKHKAHPGACQEADEKFIRSLGQRFKIRNKKHTETKSGIPLLKNFMQE